MNPHIQEYRLITYYQNIYNTSMIDVEAYIFGYGKLTADVITLIKLNLHVIKGCYSKYLDKIKQDIREYCNKYGVSFQSL